jgi:hypothetical protein
VRGAVAILTSEDDDDDDADDADDAESDSVLLQTCL